MALTDSLRSTLFQAIRDYKYPFVTFDFEARHEITHPSMRKVEVAIRDQLLSDNLEAAKDGLSNVLYWGYARVGFRNIRVERFRQNVTDAQLHKASLLFRRIEGPGVRQIAHLYMPEFRGLSFVSKIRMFLDTSRHVVLDRQLLKLREQQRPTIFHEVRIGHNESMIRVTRHNETIYERWSTLCRDIAAKYSEDEDVRAVDVERGIFHLVQTERVDLAAEILDNA